MSDDFTAASALAAMQESRAAWAGRSSGKGARYQVLYGLIVGILVGGQALDAPFNLVTTLGCAAAISLLTLYCVRKSGVWVTGIGPQRARWVAVGFGVLAIGAAMSVYWAAHHGMAWVGWPAGAVMTVIGALAARLWRWVYRSDMLDATDTRPDSISRRPQLILFGMGLVLLLAAALFALFGGGVDGAMFAYSLGAAIGIFVVGGGFTLVRALGARARR